MQKMRKVFYVAVGVGLGYLLDPISGRSRRARFGDQAAALMRKSQRAIERRARYQTGRARGWLCTTFNSPTPPSDDSVLRQKIRSEAVGPSRVKNVDVEVTDGEVILRGTAANHDVAEDLIERVTEVPGVRTIRNELRFQA